MLTTLTNSVIRESSRIDSSDYTLVSRSWVLISVLGYWPSSFRRGIKLLIFLSNEGNQDFLEKLVVQKCNLEHLLVRNVRNYQHTHSGSVERNKGVLWKLPWLRLDACA